MCGCAFVRASEPVLSVHRSSCRGDVRTIEGQWRWRYSAVRRMRRGAFAQQARKIKPPIICPALTDLIHLRRTSLILGVIRSGFRRGEFCGPRKTSGSRGTLRVSWARFQGVSESLIRGKVGFSREIFGPLRNIQDGWSGASRRTGGYPGAGKGDRECHGSQFSSADHDGCHHTCIRQRSAFTAVIYLRLAFRGG